MDNFQYSPVGRHRLFLFTGIIIAVLLVFAAVFLVRERTSWSGRAQVSDAAIFSRENSYLFASPITATANGTSLIRVTVFLLNGQGLGVAGLSVKLNISGPATLIQTQPVTDNFGRAIFDVSATIPGDYTISAEAKEQPLLQKVSVSFH